VGGHYTTGDGEKREEVTFVDCAVFGRQAEVIQQYCAKGHPLYVEGRLRYDSWEDKNGGGKRSKLSVIVENFQFLKGKEQQGGEEREQTLAPPSRRGNGPGVGFRHPPRDPNPPVTQPFGDEDNHFDEKSIPF
jgi:single-strand DNA-binding protein